MRKRMLPYAIALLLTMLAADQAALAQQTTANPQNQTVMNRYTYAPVAFQRGSSTQEVRLFPNPARSTTQLYINSIQGKDRGELMITNTNGTVVLRNTVQPGSNDVNISSLSEGMYFLKVFTKDRYLYTQQLVVLK